MYLEDAAVFSLSMSIASADSLRYDVRMRRRHRRRHTHTHTLTRPTAQLPAYKDSNHNLLRFGEEDSARKVRAALLHSATSPLPALQLTACLRERGQQGHELVIQRALHIVSFLDRLPQARWRSRRCAPPCALSLSAATPTLQTQHDMANFTADAFITPKARGAPSARTRMRRSPHACVRRA